MTDEPRTLFAVKLKSSRRTKELVGLLVILLGLGAVIGFVAAVQWSFCPPNITLKKCLLP